MTISMTNPRAKQRWGALAAVIFTISLFGAAVTLAVHDDGAFELDRNAASSSAPGEDWDAVHAGTDTADSSTFVNDGIGPTIFTGGGSKDDLNTTGWKHKSGQTPDKDELLNAYAARYGDLLYFGADRYSNSGDAVMGFWFFQNEVTALAGGTFGPGAHKDGDILVLSDFTNGGGNVTIRVYRWNGPGGDIAGSGAINGTLDLIAGTAAQTADCVGPPSVANGDPYCATVNTANTPSPWPFQAKASGAPANVFPPGHFFEGGIDLGFLNLGEECFASFLAETRSSTSVDATLKDFVGGGFERCESTVTTTPSDANGDPVSAITLGSSIYDYALIEGTGSSNPPTGTMEFWICSPAQLDDASTTDDPATCDVGGTKVNGSGAPNAAVSVTPISGTSNAEATSSAFTPTTTGTWCWRGVYSGDSNYPPASDSSSGECFAVVNARISVSPLTATNESGSNHTVTATVEQDTGSGFTMVAGALVTFSLHNNNAGAVFTAAGNTCTTSAAGTCSIQITTTATGTVDIRASTTITVSGLSITRTTGTTGNGADANKRFVDAQIDLSPLTDSNSIGENHVITATVQQDDGLAASTGGGDAVSGYGPAPDGTLVVFNFQQNTIGATFVADGTDSNADGNSGNDCVTTAGTCSITIVSNAAGTVIVRATTTFDIGPAPVESVTRTTGSGGLNSADASKTFVAGTLTWLKDDNAGSRLAGATFEVCRTHTLNSSTGVQVDTTDVCRSITDDSDGTVGASDGLNGPDQDGDAGEFRLTNLVLGRYTVRETAAPAGFALDPDTETADDMTLTDPDAAIAVAFVDNREVLKITGFGYTNSATGTPTSGVVSGTATFTVDLRNYGSSAATLTNSSIKAAVTGAGSGTLTCNGDGASPALEKAITGTIAAGGTLGPITLECTYTGMADGAVISATLNIKSTTNGLERLASGSPATVSFTVQAD